jgi:hypothetical protein
LYYSNNTLRPVPSYFCPPLRIRRLQ